MLLDDRTRKLLADAIRGGSGYVADQATTLYNDPLGHLKTSAEDTFGNQDERNAMVTALRSGKSPMDTAAGDKLKNLAMGLIFAGPGAKTADLLKLNVAQRMEQAGAKADDILKSTGWFKGMEGKWKYEIPDDTARFSTGPMTGGKTVNAPEVLKHEALYAAYPHLRQTRVGPMPHDVPGGTVGMFQGPSFPSGGQMFLKQGARKDTALHELQHAIQEQEGFGLGGSPVGTTMQSADDALQAYRRMAGEIEARNVQKRMTMNPKRRMDIPPWLTQDIPPEQAIIRTK